MNGLMNFECNVHESGYEIIHASELEPYLDLYEAGYYLRPVDPTSPKRVFNLAEQAGAYLEFADSFFNEIFNNHRNLTPSNLLISINNLIIKYANKYGLLYSTTTTTTHPENLLFWVENMLDMANIIYLLEILKNGKDNGFDEYFIEKDGEFRVDDKGLTGLLKNLDLHLTKENYVDIPIVGQTTPRIFSESVYHYICGLVNINLWESLTTEIVMNRTKSGMEITIQPTDLSSSLWLQLAHALSNNLEFKQCAACSTFFEVKSKKRKNEKIYCSDRCRVRVGARKRREKEKAK